MASASRTGFNRLLCKYPDAEIARVFHQDEHIVDLLRKGRRLEIFPLPRTGPGPWTVVDLVDGDELRSFAIWNLTGNVYVVDEFGAAEDDPVVVVTEL